MLDVSWAKLGSFCIIALIRKWVNEYMSEFLIGRKLGSFDIFCLLPRRHQDTKFFDPSTKYRAGRITGFFGIFSRSCVLGKGFSRCEHLSKPFAFDHGHLLWPTYTIRPAKKDFLLDIDLQEYTKTLVPPGLIVVSISHFSIRDVL